MLKVQTVFNYSHLDEALKMPPSKEVLKCVKSLKHVHNLFSLFLVSIYQFVFQNKYLFKDITLTSRYLYQSKLVYHIIPNVRQILKALTCLLLNANCEILVVKC